MSKRIILLFVADKKQLTIVKETPNYWRVVFESPAVNCFGVWTSAELNLPPRLCLV